MIAFPDKMPLLRLHDDRVVKLECDWLAGAINEAADDAGYEHWWLVPHILESITSYLEFEFNANVISCNNLDTLIANVLRVIGYSDVARHFHLPEPPVRVSLYTLAKNADTGFELVFFDNLNRTIRNAVASRSSLVELYDLTACVKHLRRARVWRKDCTHLRDEIVAYARASASSSPRNRPLNLSLL